jgi:hypothetical protein
MRPFFRGGELLSRTLGGFRIFKRDDAIPYSLAIVTSLSCALAAGLRYGDLKPFLTSLEHLQRWKMDHAPLEQE